MQVKQIRSEEHIAGFVEVDLRGSRQAKWLAREFSPSEALKANKAWRLVTIGVPAPSGCPHCQADTGPGGQATLGILRVVRMSKI